MGLRGGEVAIAVRFVERILAFIIIHDERRGRSVASMDLPPTLPSPPDTSDPNILQAYAIVQNGYLAARGILNLGQPDSQQLRYHQGRVTSELVPLLDAISVSASDPAILPWCHVTAKSLADLYNCLSQHEAAAQRRFDFQNHC